MSKQENKDDVVQEIEITIEEEKEGLVSNEHENIEVSCDVIEETPEKTSHEVQQELSNEDVVEIEIEVEEENEKSINDPAEQHEELSNHEEKVIEHVFESAYEEGVNNVESKNSNNNGADEHGGVEETLKGDARSLLNKFKDYISSDKFDSKCEEKANEYGLKKDIVKNSFIRNVLGTIANALHLTIRIGGDIIKGAVNFINDIIQNIVNFTANTLHKLISLITLNCGNETV